jgi:hypothetical protein
LFDRKNQHSKESPILIPYAQVIRVQSLLIDDPKPSLEPDVKVLDILKDSICNYCTRFRVLVLGGVMVLASSTL